jgi:hypothetical protein
VHADFGSPEGTSAGGSDRSHDRQSRGQAAPDLPHGRHRSDEKAGLLPLALVKRCQQSKSRWKLTSQVAGALAGAAVGLASALGVARNGA